jgi:hypothetical protein
MREAQNFGVSSCLLREGQDRLREAQLAEARFGFVQILWKISFWKIYDLDSILF